MFLTPITYKAPDMIFPINLLVHKSSLLQCLILILRYFQLQYFAILELSLILFYSFYFSDICVYIYICVGE
jgi:hypothetical protein